MTRCLEEVKREEVREKEKSALICREVENFLRQSNKTSNHRHPLSSVPPANDLTTTKSLKTMATSSSQSRIDKNDENVRPQ